MIDEVWCDVPDYEGMYQVSNTGKVKSLSRIIKTSNGKLYHRKENILKPFYEKRGYMRVKLCKNGTEKMFCVHRLVATCFIPNVYNREQVNHIDGNKTNNNASNLEWCTNEQNMKHAWECGLREHRKRKVRCLNNNEVYSSIKEASLTLNIVESGISNVVRGVRKHYKGYKFEYVG